jgi:hypothetical protein
MIGEGRGNFRSFDVVMPNVKCERVKDQVNFGKLTKWEMH